MGICIRTGVDWTSSWPELDWPTTTLPACRRRSPASCPAGAPGLASGASQPGWLRRGRRQRRGGGRWRMGGRTPSCSTSSSPRSGTSECGGKFEWGRQVQGPRPETCRRKFQQKQCVCGGAQVEMTKTTKHLSLSGSSVGSPSSRCCGAPYRSPVAFAWAPPHHHCACHTLQEAQPVQNRFCSGSYRSPRAAWNPDKC